MTRAMPDLRTTNALRLDLTLAWPCATHVLSVAPTSSAESELRLTMSLAGPEDRLTGVLRAYVAKPDEPDCGACDRNEAAPDERLAVTATATLRRFGDWVALDVRGERGVRVDLLCRDSFERASDRAPAYVATSLFEVIGLAGGRYGSPILRGAT
ncbi:MAG: hypothetical protein JNM94_14050 [Phycisphaerae bacterium]|nr:hypothetical protein [Phycisphaerae bacterium]